MRSDSQQTLRCTRCGSGADHMHWTRCGRCRKRCPYCLACLQFGKVRSCSIFVYGVKQGRTTISTSVTTVLGTDCSASGHAPLAPSQQQLIRRWSLSPAQAEASAKALAYLQRPPAGGNTPLHPNFAPNSQSGLQPSGHFHSRSSRPSDFFEEVGSQSGGNRNSLSSRRLSVDESGLQPSGHFHSRSTYPLATDSKAVESFLIWAVTGAGKTEMLFPLIDYELQRGNRVLVATPRKDVVLELHPRLERSFPSIPIVALYGGSPDKWRQAPLVISTTHQLLRFRHAFDLVVIDEVDAFPFHNDPLLHRMSQRACHPGGHRVFLTATPPDSIRDQVASGRMGHVIVPARYHGHPLPVPVIYTRYNVKLRTYKLAKELARSLERGAQCFVFVPTIEQVEPLARTLGKRFPNVRIEGTSSVDPERESRVIRFRERQIRILVTTTILERGVTVPKSDVFIFDADADLFDEAALVQMAGRAGRSADDPAGRVCFLSREKTTSQIRAVRSIKRMNTLAHKGGFLAQTNKKSRRSKRSKRSKRRNDV